MKIKQAIDEWTEWLYFKGCEDTTVHTYETSILSWFNATKLLSKDVTYLDRKILDSFVNQHDGTSLATKKMKLFLLRSFCYFCWAEGYHTKNPAALMSIRMKELTHKQKEPKKKIPYTHEEYNQLIAGLETFLATAKGFKNLQRKKRCRFWRSASIISYWTGLRFGDICVLERDSFSGDELTVWTDKRDKRVSLPLKPDYMGDGVVIKTLNDLEGDKTHFFPEERDIYLDLFRKCGLFQSFKRWSEHVGLPGRTFHCLRHSFVTRLRKDGVSLEDIGKLVGHSSTSTTEGYYHS